ncbi:P-loop containing nucleoside triphosphate hydrolase protein [Gorgonomyces haynaldii]|nr:P-loop containing nucleoside triphosphate hydrolase protein [Gorgonomyces haynaldii]
MNWDFPMSKEILVMRDSTKMPEGRLVSFMNNWTYSWLNPLLKEGARSHLQMDTILPLPEEYHVEAFEARISKAWEQEVLLAKVESRDLNLRNAMWREFWRDLLYAGSFRFVSDLCNVFSPLLLKYLVAYLSDSQAALANNTEPPHVGTGIFYTLMLLSLAVIASLFSNHQVQLTTSLALALKAGFTSKIYKKAVNLSFLARQKYDSSKVVSIVSTDCYRIEIFLVNFNVLWAAPIQILVTTGFLLAFMGWSALPGLALLCLGAPIQNTIMQLLRRVRASVAPITDERVKKTQEGLLGIRVLKFFNWEKPFMEQIRQLRKRELTQVLRRGLVQAFVMLSAFSLPVFAGIVTVIVYVLFNDVNTAIIFSGLAWFTQIRQPLFWLPQAIAFYSDFSVGIERIQGLLASKELDPLPASEHELENALEIDNATFYWETEDRQDLKPQLLDINIKIPKGSLVGVVGQVGSGKSTLLNAIIGECSKSKGSVKLFGNLGYAPQQAWIQNGTIRDNILFGQPFDQERYYKVLFDCALTRDLEIWPDGDMTEIGERGINLSGGQKQRINLARLVYYSPDIAMMDDPLSAVDVHVGQHIFTNCIQGALKDKTRILVTHQLHILPSLDYIYVLKDGKLVEQGNYADLLSNNGEFAQYLKEYELTMNNQETEEAENVSERMDGLERIKQSMAKTEQKKARQLMQVEDRETGSVAKEIWWLHFKSSGPWLWTAVFTIFVFQFFKIGTDYWVVFWSNRTFPLTTQEYLGWYVGWGVAQAITIWLVGVFFAYGSITGARILHDSALGSLLNAPLSFFDATPMGRIMNRFAKDVDGVDNAVLDALRRFLLNLANTIIIFGVIVYGNPIFAGPLVVVLVMYYFIQGHYRKTSRELKRLDSTSRSPLFAQIGETLSGLTTIRSYQVEPSFVKKNTYLINNNQQPYFLLMSAAQWLSIRLEMVSAFVVFFAALFGVLYRFTYPASIFAFVLTYALQVTQVMNFMVKLFVESENAMNMVERIAFYGQKLSQEAPQHLDPVRETWPEKGEIEFRNLDIRYAPELPLVLTKINIKIEHKEKIGIVGRTGSGKSTMIHALFRTLEASGGDIVISGMVTKNMGLADLRSGLGIIPQDPVVFSGTVRVNLDPFDRYDDNELWRALESASLKEKIVEIGGLDGKVTAGGENLSVGQRQLLCLARALLVKPVIMIMDEATANVDYETDEKIQECLRRDFKDTTLLTIAHRLNTILDYDRILVLDKGHVVEFDSPRNLMAKEVGIFKEMVLDSGINYTANA